MYPWSLALHSKGKVGMGYRYRSRVLATQQNKPSLLCVCPTMASESIILQSYGRGVGCGLRGEGRETFKNVSQEEERHQDCDLLRTGAGASRLSMIDQSMLSFFSGRQQAKRPRAPRPSFLVSRSILPNIYTPPEGEAKDPYLL